MVEVGFLKDIWQPIVDELEEVLAREFLKEGVK